MNSWYHILSSDISCNHILSHDITEQHLIATDNSCIRSGCLVECWRALVIYCRTWHRMYRRSTNIIPYYSLLPALILAASMPDPLPPVLPDESLLKNLFLKTISNYRPFELIWKNFLGNLKKTLDRCYRR